MIYSIPDLSTGPTSILGLLTAEIVVDLKDEFTPAQISTAVALMVGVYSLILGMLELGFILDYVSVPVLTGFISATALVIGFGQVPSLIGLSNMPSGVFYILGDMLKRLPQWDGPTCGVGFGTIVMLLALEKVGKRWGKKHFLIKYVASSRAVIVLVVFTLISWGVNHDRDPKKYIFAVTKVHTNGIMTPSVPQPDLVSRVALRAIAPFMACALEHLAVGKAFGRKNNYTIGQSQELNYLGVTNILNSFFHVMPVGGAMSRTAVNSECRVRSPLYGVITAGFIVLTLYVFSPALYWLPKSTLAAIIVCCPTILSSWNSSHISETNPPPSSVTDHGRHPPLRPALPLLAVLAHLPGRLHRQHGRLLDDNLCLCRDWHRRRRRLQRALVPHPPGL